MAQVSVGKTTVAGGAVTLVSFAAAVVAFVQGARDEATISVLAVGVIALVTTLGGRYAQAVAMLLQGWRNAPLPEPKPKTEWIAGPPLRSENFDVRPPQGVTSQGMVASASSTPRPVAEMSTQELADAHLRQKSVHHQRGGRVLDFDGPTQAVKQRAEPAPFTPDGDPVDGDEDESDRLAHLSDESWCADPSDEGGGTDHPKKGGK